MCPLESNVKKNLKLKTKEQDQGKNRANRFKKIMHVWRWKMWIRILMNTLQSRTLKKCREGIKIFHNGFIEI